MWQQSMIWLVVNLALVTTLLLLDHPSFALWTSAVNLCTAMHIAQHFNASSGGTICKGKWICWNQSYVCRRDHITKQHSDRSYSLAQPQAPTEGQREGRRQAGMDMGTGVDGAGDVVVQVFGLAQSPLNADALAFRPMGG